MKQPPADLTDRLLAASPQLLRQGGVPRFEEVAAAVGVSRATLYYYFSGQDDLLGFLLTAHIAEGAAAMAAADPGGGDTAERLRAVLAAVVAYVGARPAMCSGLLSAAASDSQFREVLAVNDARIARPLRALIAAGMADGRFGVADAGDAANAILGATLLAVLGRAAATQDPAASDFQEALVAQLLRGLAAG